MKNYFKKFLSEMPIIFLGAFLAFLADRLLQTIQDNNTNIVNLKTIRKAVESDTSRLNWFLKKVPHKERLLFAERFHFSWYQKGIAPSDSLFLFYHYFLMPLGLRSKLMINDAVLPKLKEIVDTDIDSVK